MNKKNVKDRALYNKVNTTCHGGKKYHGNEEDYNRGSTKEKNISKQKKMKSGKQHHGLNYNPLYSYLRKHVGEKWSTLHSDIMPRLPSHLKDNPLDYAVLSFKDYSALSDDEKTNCTFRTNEATFHSKMYVDENDLLQFISPTLTINDLKASCNCCTHTLNGKVFK